MRLESVSKGLKVDERFFRVVVEVSGVVLLIELAALVRLIEAS